MAILGVLSGVLSFFDYNLSILVWVYMWGETVGWAIRIGLIVVGAILFLAFRCQEENTNLIEVQEQQEKLRNNRI